MGRFTIWAITAQNQSVEELLEPYDEENDIPGTWPGLSFDYFEIEETISPGTAASNIQTNRGDMPWALICNTGQIPWAEPEATGASHGMPPILPGGPGQMLQEIVASETGQVHIIDWHA